MFTNLLFRMWIVFEIFRRLRLTFRSVLKVSLGSNNRMSKSIHCHPTQTKLKQALSLDTLTLGCPGCLKVISLTSRLEKTIMVIVLCFDDALPYRNGAMPNSRQVNEWMLICMFSYLIVTRQTETAMVECSTKRCGKLRAPGGGCLLSRKADSASRRWNLNKTLTRLFIDLRNAAFKPSSSWRQKN